MLFGSGLSSSDIPGGMMELIKEEFEALNCNQEEL